MTATSVRETARLVTAEEYERMDSNLRLNLIEGELVPMPPMPGEQHGAVTMTLGAYATVYVLEHNLGRCYAAETRFIVQRNPDTTMGPDWAFTARDRLTGDALPGFSAIVPDIVLEVRSPGDTATEAEGKMQRWLRAGVRLGWEFNPATRLLTVYRPNEAPRPLSLNDTLTGEDVLPGFVFPLHRLFSDSASTS